MTEIVHKKALKAAAKIEQWKEPDVTFVVTALLYHLASICDCTIRELGEEIISNMEFYWALDGGNLAEPPYPFEIDLPPR
jgi:hypothetical protein